MSYPVRKLGFTLVELLVVVAVIGLLAGLLFPVFARARENARRASCASNLHQIGLGFQQYAQDYDERLPGRIMGKDSGQGETNSWRRVLYPYLRSQQIFACPSNQFRDQTCLDDFAPRSYVANGNAANIGGTPPMPVDGASAGDGKPLSAIADTSRTILVMEGETDYSEATVGFAPSIFADDMFRGHLGTCNFLFADSHVKTMKPLATAQLVNMWTIEDDGPGPGTLNDLLTAWEAKIKSGG